MKRNHSYFFVLIFSALIIFLRKSDSILNPQFWAEDGTVFFADQFNYGISSLIKPYVGYLHLVPRLIALLTHLTGAITFAPLIYNLGSFVITIFVISHIFSPRLNLNRKPILALSLVLIPLTSSEVFLTITNLQWLLAVLLVIVLLKESPDTMYGSVIVQQISDVAIVILCGLTGPFIVFLLPFFLWRCRPPAKNFDILLAFAAVTVACVQMYFVLDDDFVPITTDNTIYRVSDFAKILGQRMFGNLFLGSWLPYRINAFVLCVLFLLVIMFVVDTVRRERKRGFPAALFLLFSTTITVTMFWRFLSTDLRPYLMNFLTPGWCERYFYLPYVMICWSLVICMDHDSLWRKLLAGICLAIIFISSVTSGFCAKPLPDLNWKNYSSQITSSSAMAIPINPSGWEIHLSGSDRSLPVKAAP